MVGNRMQVLTYSARLFDSERNSEKPISISGSKVREFSETSRMG